MGRTSAAARYNREYRRLMYGDIELVPVTVCDEHLHNANKWHVPGGEILSTDSLVYLATQKGITVILIAHDGTAVDRTRLN